MKTISTLYGKLLVGLLALTIGVGRLPRLEASPYQTQFSQFSAGDQLMVTHVTSGGQAGDLITISGQQLQTVTSVLFNGVPAKPTNVDLKGFFLQVQVPNQATTGPITLLTSNSRLLTNATFRVLTKNSPDPERQKILDSDRAPEGLGTITKTKPTASRATAAARLAATGGTISGMKFEDLDRDGTRTVQTTIGSPVVLFVLDVSGSTTNSFPGTTVGDLNGRNGPNDIIDAEIAVVERIRTELISRGAVNSQIGIVTFQATAAVVDVDPSIPGVQNFALVQADNNNNGRSDISETYTTAAFITGGGTSYTNGLKKAITLVNTLPTTQEIKIIFLSDGVPDPADQNGATEAATLRSKPNVSLSAIGIGATTLTHLRRIDPNARAVTNFDNLINFSLDIITPLEGGLAGVVLYLDVNNNGQRDSGEPSQSALADNPATTADETGLFSFTGLAAGTYTVREEVPVGYVQTAPSNKAYTITIIGTESFTNTNFGNVRDDEQPVISGVPASLTVSCPGDVPALATDVTATDNLDSSPTLTASETRVDGTCANRYVITRTWTATDDAQNQTTATQTITVDDLTAPTLSGVPTQPLVVSALTDICSTTISFPAITASDNCNGAVTVSYLVGGTPITPGSSFPLGTTTVEVIATDPCNNQTSSSFTVQVNDVTAPVPDLGALPALTNNCTLVISNRPTATDNCGGQITATTTDPLTYSTPGSYTVTWTYTDPSGNGSQQTQLIQINEPPQPPTVANVSYCLGTTAMTLSATATSTGVLNWYDATNNALSSAPMPPTSPSGTTLYFVSQTINGCESNKASISVTVNDLPSPTITGLASAYCQDATAVLLNGAPTGGTFTIDGSPATTLTPASLSVGQHTVVYSYTNASGCSNTTTQTVTINALPLVSITGLGATYCRNADVVTLMGSPVNGTFTIDGTMATTFDPSTLSIGQHTAMYSYTNASGCSNTTTQTVTINALPTPAITSLSTNYCKDATAVALTGSPAGGAFTVDGINATVFTPASLSVGQHTVVYSYTNASGCSNATTQTVTINDAPQAPSLLTQGGQHYPGGQVSVTVPQYSGTVTLVPNGCPIGSIHWSGPANSTGMGIITVSTNTIGTFIYSAICQQGGCSSVPTSATVIVKSDQLRVITPLLDCATGKLTLRTTGGNGQPIEYQVPSVNNGWSSTNPISVEAKDFKKSLKLRARQRSSDNRGFDTAELDYQLPDCPSPARLGTSEEPASRLTVVVLGNPVLGQEVVVEVRGALGHPLQLQLTDLKGHIISQHFVEVADDVELQHLPLNHQPAGLLLLQVNTPTQRQQLKLIKP